MNEMLVEIISMVVIGVMLLLYGILIFFSLISYVITGVSLMKISKKLGVEKGWLAFVPMANYWLLGRLAEEDGKRYHPEKKQKKWGKIYLTVGIVYLVAVLLLTSAYLVFSIVGSLGAAQSGSAAVAEMGVLRMVVQISYEAVLMALAFAVMIVGYVIFYKVYHAMAGDGATWMLVLTILVPVSQLVLMLMLAFSKKYPVEPPVSFSNDYQGYPEEGAVAYSQPAVQDSDPMLELKSEPKDTDTCK